MELVLQNMPVQVPLWNAALNGAPNWAAIYGGFQSAVDWPTAAFFRELGEAYPTAKFVLTERDPENWADSFGSTIYTLIGRRDKAPPEKKAWIEMGYGVIAKSGFPDGLSRDELIKAFVAHNATVKQTIPADRLLSYRVTTGWDPLCQFLGVQVPDAEFPKTNDRAEFWEIVRGGKS
jgi:Sulfotransferase domain